MQNRKSGYPHVQKSNSGPGAPYITTDALLPYSHHKTDWPSETMSHHMINIYLCLPVRWKKDNLLLMHLCYYSYLSPSEMREQRRAGGSTSVCWIWTYWVRRTSLSATNSPAEYLHHMWTRARLKAMKRSRFESPILFHTVWILLQWFQWPPWLVL